MVIQFKAIFELISKYHAPKSIESIIADCNDGYEESLNKAIQLEDYRYLMVMKEYREENSEKYCIFWDYKNEYATLLVNNQDISVIALGKLAFDYQSIPKEEFKDLLLSIADRDGFNQELELESFEFAYKVSEIDYALLYNKNRRNDQCPCGSGKKYKFCHGN